MRRIGLLVAVGAAILLAVGCGGGGSSSGTASSTTAGRSAGDQPSRAEWRDHANAICHDTREANAQRLEEFVALLRHGLTTPKLRDEAATLVRAGVKVVEGEVDSFNRLTPPASVRGSADTLVEKLEDAASLEGRFAAALEHGSAHELGALGSKVVANETALRGLALHLGLHVCGKLFQVPTSQGLA